MINLAAEVCDGRVRLTLDAAIAALIPALALAYGLVACAVARLVYTHVVVSDHEQAPLFAAFLGLFWPLLLFVVALEAVFLAFFVTLLRLFVATAGRVRRLSWRDDD